MRIKITFTLDHESDTDILNYLDSMSAVARNAHICQAIRDHIAIERNQTTLKELYAKVEILINRLELTLEHRKESYMLKDVPAVNQIKMAVGDSPDDQEIEGNLSDIGT